MLNRQVVLSRSGSSVPTYELCVLPRIEVPVASQERAEGVRRQLAEQILDASVRSHISIPA